MNSIDFSPVAVTFQAIGTLLLGGMLWQIGRNFAWRYAREWAYGWLSLFVAILSVRLFIAVENETAARWFWTVYLLAQWSFLVLLYAGCRRIAGSPVRLRYALYGAPLLATIAGVMAHFARGFNDLFTIEAGVVAIGAFAAFHALAQARRSIGWQMMRVSLVAVAILYLAYVPLYAFYTRGYTITILSYSSLVDLMGEVFLGFSMVLIAAEEARRELQDAVDALKVARDRLEAKLHTDPLTEALTRHAFHAMPPGATGVAIMLDVDSLKQINDEAGHAAGDAAIRAVANAVRARIRADDLLFRWGGDEFLIIVPGSTLEMVRERLDPLARGVTSEHGQLVRFSWGAAEFGERSLEEAMRLADEAMYRKRSASRATA